MKRYIVEITWSGYREVEAVDCSGAEGMILAMADIVTEDICHMNN